MWEPENDKIVCMGAAKNIRYNPMRRQLNVVIEMWRIVIRHQPKLPT